MVRRAVASGLGVTTLVASALASGCLELPPPLPELPGTTQIFQTAVTGPDGERLTRAYELAIDCRRRGTAS